MNKICSYIALLGIIFLLNPTYLHAQNNGNNQQPVEISAERNLEWLQNKKQYIANGNVKAKQGDITIFAEKIIAYYKDEADNPKNSGIEIWQLTALENVRIINTDTVATGDKAIYNVDTGLAVLTGSKLKITTPNQVITADERMEYNTQKGVAKAIGNAIIIEEKNKLHAPTITAYFKKDKTGKETLKTAKAEGGVTITTPDETLTGSTATYNAQQNVATVLGNVKIMRGPNILEGARGEINLSTNVSKIFSSQKKGDRVRAVFFPSSNNND